jgi:hypothetical protein
MSQACAQVLEERETLARQKREKTEQSVPLAFAAAQDLHLIPGAMHNRSVSSDNLDCEIVEMDHNSLRHDSESRRPPFIQENSNMSASPHAIDLPRSDGVSEYAEGADNTRADIAEISPQTPVRESDRTPPSTGASIQGNSNISALPQEVIDLPGSDGVSEYAEGADNPRADIAEISPQTPVVEPDRKPPSTGVPIQASFFMKVLASVKTKYFSVLLLLASIPIGLTFSMGIGAIAATLGVLGFWGHQSMQNRSPTGDDERQLLAPTTT